jgi:predicted lipid-binding transport protein (Tim44 family)
MFYGFSSRLLGGILGDMFLGKRGRENTPGWGGSGMGLLDIAFLLVLVGIVYMIIQRIRERKARTAASSGGGYVPHNYRQSVYDVSSSEPLMDDPVSSASGVSCRRIRHSVRTDLRRRAGHVAQGPGSQDEQGP